MKHKRFMILCSLIGFLAVLTAAEDPRRQKMCWAHYVGWGFNQTDGYDLAMRSPGSWMLAPFGDRTLLGKNLQWDSGIFFGARKQIETALAYGVDGFCVDIVNPNSYVGGLERFFRDAEGTPFKVALCIDRLSYDNAYLIEHLGKFIATYKDHPNACRIDGKMVIFVYNIAGKKIDDWLAVRAELKKQGLDAYYLVQPAHETSMWSEPDKLADALRGFEGFYDFGCNGFTPDEMKQRLANGRAALKAHRPDGLFAGGIAIGYIGQGSSFYRPFLNSGTLRHNWEASIANNVDWVCLTTWNDYIESTQFEPSVINRDNLLRINREYVSKWRGEPAPQRTPQVIYTYHDETVLGDDLTFEVMNFSYTTAPASALVRLLAPDGRLLKEFAPVQLNPKKLAVKTFRLRHEEMKDWKVMRVQAAVVSNGEKPQYKELHPIVRRSGRTESVRTLRLRQDDMTGPETELRIEAGPDGRSVAKITLKSWMFAGKAELLRNGWPVAELEINHLHKPVWERTVPLEWRRSPEDVYVVRVTDVSGRLGFSNPALHRAEGFDGKTRLPVIVTGSDFDENWPLWKKRISRLKRPEVVAMPVADSDIFSVRYDFDKPVDGMLISTSGWSIPAQLGSSKGWWQGCDKDTVPQWKNAAGPDGTERTVLAFDGTDVVAIAARAMPTGPFTIEQWIKPERKEADMVLFEDQMGVQLLLDAQLRPRLTRGGHITGASVQSDKAVPAGKWTHLAAVYDGKSLKIYQDGRKTAEAPAPTCTNPVNSLSRIGNSMNLDRGFKGRMAGFSLEGAVRAPGSFRLKK